MKKLLLIALLLAPAPALAGDKEDMLDIYRHYQIELVACQDVDCFKALVKKYGSHGSIESLSTVAPDTLKYFFTKEKDDQAERMAREDFYLETYHVKDYMGALIFKLKNSPAITDEVYFVKENGVWKKGQ